MPKQQYNCSVQFDTKTNGPLQSLPCYLCKWMRLIFVSSSVCKLCIHRLEFLEKAAADLQAFRELAQHFMSTYQSCGPLKRTRVTSSDIGVSPYMARERPSSKLARKKVVFSCFHDSSQEKNNDYGTFVAVVLEVYPKGNGLVAQAFPIARR